MIAVMSGDKTYEKVVESFKAERRPRKLNEYVKKYREQLQAIGGIRFMRSKGDTDQEIISELMSSYEDLTKEGAKAYIAMADEEMKGVTA